MTVAVWLLRLAGRLLIAASFEIDRALSEYRVEIPPTVPDWMDAEADL